MSSAPSDGTTVSDLLRLGYSVERAEREATHVTIPRPQYEALIAALEATRLFEAAELFHANCEECDGEIEMELCGQCFPLADDARLKRRESLEKAHAAGIMEEKT
jgi:hypothetical protein